MIELDDEDEDTKNVYAHFGLAYYTSGVFEYGLVLAITQADFISKQLSEIQGKGIKGFDRDIFEKKFDQFIDKLHQKDTMGKLIARLKVLTRMDEDFKNELGQALGRRNYLAHHFFRNHAESLMKAGGRAKMVEELEDHRDFFSALDKKLDEFMRPIREKIGMPDDLIASHIEQYMRELRDTD